MYSILLSGFKYPESWGERIFSSTYKASVWLGWGRSVWVVALFLQYQWAAYDLDSL